MRVYAERWGKALQQVALDVVVLLWVFLWVRIGQAVHGFVGGFAEPGRQMERAGERLSGIGSGGVERVEGLPLVGEVLRAPLEAIVSGGRALTQAGVEQQQAVATAALWVGLAVALAPILAVLLTYVPGRLRWVTAASTAQRLRDAGGSDRLFALRALTNQPLRSLRRAERDPWGAYERGDLARLADLELRALGLRGRSRLSAPADRAARDR